MQITTYGRTAETKATETDIVRIIREVQAVRRNIRKLADWTVTREEAIEMAELSARGQLIDRLGAKASRMKDRLRERPGFYEVA